MKRFESVIITKGIIRYMENSKILRASYWQRYWKRRLKGIDTWQNKVLGIQSSTGKKQKDRKLFICKHKSFLIKSRERVPQWAKPRAKNHFHSKSHHNQGTFFAPRAISYEFQSDSEAVTTNTLGSTAFWI